MIIRTPDYYPQFKCIAEKCTDTCCAGWQVDVDDRSYAYYKTVGGEFGERLCSVMTDGKKGAEGQFRIRPDGRCPFLNDTGLCDLYTELGEDALCVTCASYPRYTCEFGNLRETGIALSCKTAAELILGENRTPGFIEHEDTEIFPSLNNIDADLYTHMMKARNHAFEIIWDRAHTIPERMMLLLNYGEQLQKYIRNPEKMDSVTEQSCPDRFDGDEVKFYRNLWKLYLKQAIIKREWPLLADKAEKLLYNENYITIKHNFHEHSKPYMYEYENILTYFVFRYFMKGVFDRDLLTGVKMAVISTLMIIQCDMAEWAEKGSLSFDDRVEIAHLYSREVEHSEENFDNLCRGFRKMRVIIKIL